MLILNPSNIGDVYEALNSLCLREFQTIGEAISTLTLSTITSLPNSPVDLTPYSTANDPHGFAAKAYHEELKQNKIEIETRKREQLKLYGYLTSILSRESRELVISDAKYSAIQTATNRSGHPIVRMPSGLRQSIVQDLPERIHLREKWKPLHALRDTTGPVSDHPQRQQVIH
jgi:hypothetical protein